MDHEQFMEDDGRDPGLMESAYDGTEYELDEFGERIGTEDAIEDTPAEADDMSEDEMTPESTIEDGFGETLKADADPNIADQLEDDNLSEEAESDYKTE